MDLGLFFAIYHSKKSTSDISVYVIKKCVSDLVLKPGFEKSTNQCISWKKIGALIHEAEPSFNFSILLWI